MLIKPAFGIRKLKFLEFHDERDRLQDRVRRLRGRECESERKVYGQLPLRGRSRSSMEDRGTSRDQDLEGRNKISISSTYLCLF
jgi:hypothetical protein